MTFEEIQIKVDQIIRNQSERDVILLNVCELLKKEVYHYDWVGFYILNQYENNLVLGSYVGIPTEHSHIAIGKGVCGQVAENKTTMIVQDITQMDNYIACSLEVQSEIVVPILKNGEFVAEIDIDSHSPAPFTKEDKKLLEAIAEKIANLF